MSLPLIGEAGPGAIPDGQQSVVRLGRTGELNVADAHGRYLETVYRGNVFFAATQNAAFTASAGVTLTTVVGLVISNPIGSTRSLSLLTAEFMPSGVVVGAVAAVIVPYQATAITHTTGLTVRQALGGAAASYGAGPGQSVAFADQGATVNIAPVPAKWMFACLSTNTAQPCISSVYDVGGTILLPPGTAAAILATAAITGWASATWEEIPYP